MTWRTNIKDIGRMFGALLGLLLAWLFDRARALWYGDKKR